MTSTANAPKVPTRNGIVIFDLDGCTVNDQHRLDLIDDSKPGQEKWHEYNLAAPADVVNDFALPYIQNARDHNMLIAFVTARPLVYQSIAMRQIETLFGLSLGSDFALYMRPTGDSRHAPELKAEIASHLKVMVEKSGSAIYGAFDDRQDVVDAYSQIGIPAFVLSLSGCKAPLLSACEPNPLDKYTSIIEHPSAKTVEVAQDVVDAELVPDGPTRSAPVADFRPFYNCREDVAFVAKALFPNGIPKAIPDWQREQWAMLENVLGSLVDLTGHASRTSKPIGAADDLAHYASRLQKLINKQ